MCLFESRLQNLISDRSKECFRLLVRKINDGKIAQTFKKIKIR